MRVYISGSSGFVGQNLIADFKRKNVPYCQLNLRQRDWPEQISNNEASSIIHLAGKAHDLKSASNPEEYYQVNTEITKKIYDAFLISDAEVFITLSSVKAAADRVDGVLTENIEPKPETHYGKSKLLAEEYIFSKPVPDGKRVYILRPCMIHGPGNKGNLNLLFSVVKKGIPYPLTAFDNRRSFLSIDNLCFVMDRLINDASIASGIYNIADDESISTNNVIRIISTEVGKTAKLWKVPKTLVKSIARIGDIFHLPLTTERLQKLTENYIVSNEKIKKAINVPFPVTAKEGLKKTIHSFINDD